MKRLITWLVVLTLIPVIPLIGRGEALSVTIASCTVANRDSTALGTTVHFSLEAEGAERVQLMIVPPDSSRQAADGTEIDVTLDALGTWAFVAYAKGTDGKVVNSGQWRITVERNPTETNPSMGFITDEERYVNHFFSDDYKLWSDDGKRLLHWLDSSQREDILDRNNSGYLMLDEEMVSQDQFWSKVGQGFISGSKLALETISNFGLNLILNQHDYLQWKEVFPKTGLNAVPYYLMLSRYYADYTQNTANMIMAYQEIADTIYAGSAGLAEDTVSLVNQEALLPYLASGMQQAAFGMEQTATAIQGAANALPEKSLVLAMTYTLVTTEYQSAIEGGEIVVRAAPRSSFGEFLDQKVLGLLEKMSEKTKTLGEAADRLNREQES